MGCMEKLLEALEDCGEAALFYKGTSILKANRRFAEMFGRSEEECGGLEILEICHNESIEMIRDFMHRRAVGDPGLPSTYEAFFRTPDRPKVSMHLNVIRIKGAEGALLVLVNETE